MVHPEKGDHRNHPGHGNGDCPLRRTVNAHIYGTSSNGYGCNATGGHCVKSERCAQHVADEKEYQEKNKDLIEYAEHQRHLKDLYHEAQNWR